MGRFIAINDLGTRFRSHTQHPPLFGRPLLGRGVGGCPVGLDDRIVNDSNSLIFGRFIAINNLGTRFRSYTQYPPYSGDPGDL